jgi:hypothetical protein
MDTPLLVGYIDALRKRSTGMAPRTLSSTWRQFEKLARVATQVDPPSARVLDELDELSVKANRSKVVDALQTLFVLDHTGGDGIRVRFVGGRQGVEQSEATRYDAVEKVILVNPVGVVRFIDECGECVEQLKTREARESFWRYRLCAYQAELSKLPGQMILFLTLLRQVADITDVTKSDRRGSNGGAVEPAEDKPYMMLLWALKQLEAVLREVKGINLRADYHVLWYESDWVTGRR